MMDFLSQTFEAYIPPTLPPPQEPPTILDCERSEGCFDMALPLADPCPSCGAFRMRVGDWACYGFCGVCYDNLDESAKAAL